MSDNLKVWNAVKQPPTGALKPIQAGRLKGKSDINPQWRLQAMTETFGICGIGWKYTVDRQWTEAGADGRVFAFVNVSLYVKHDGAWSDAIPGTGGHFLIEKESAGLHHNDEAFKMALTDALSVAMKCIGVAADIYMGLWDGSKYNVMRGEKAPNAAQERPKPPTPAATPPGEKNAAQSLLEELAEWCGLDDAKMEARLKECSEFTNDGGKVFNLTLQRLHSLPTGDKLPGFLKWCGSTLGKVRERRKDEGLPSICADCRQPTDGCACPK